MYPKTHILVFLSLAKSLSLVALSAHFMISLTEVDNLQGIYPLKDEWSIGCSLKTLLADQIKNSTNEAVMVKRLNELSNQPEIG